MHLFLKLFSTFKIPAKKHTRGSFACFRKTEQQCYITAVYNETDQRSNFDCSHVKGERNPS